MLSIDEAKSELCCIIGVDFLITFKDNNKGVITLTFTDKEKKTKVSIKFNTKTLSVTLAPREMDKEMFQYYIKDYITEIKRIFLSTNFNKNNSNQI